VNHSREAALQTNANTLQIPSRPVQHQRIFLRDAETSAAEKQFYEQNAWANPVVANAMLQAQPSGNHFATPQGQRRVSDLPATNGSNSTVDLMMSAPSSAMQPAPHDFDREHNETPLQNTKRLFGMENVAKPPSRLQDSGGRIETTHSSSAGTPVPRDAPEPPPSALSVSHAMLHASSDLPRDMYSLAPAPSNRAAPIGAFPP
jgi:hypothetical protein